MVERLWRAFPRPVPTALLECSVHTSRGSVRLVNVMMQWENKVEWISRSTTLSSDEALPDLSEDWSWVLEVRNGLAELSTMLEGEELLAAQRWLTDVDEQFMLATVDDVAHLNERLGLGGGHAQWWRSRVPSDGFVLLGLKHDARGNG